MEGDFRGPGAAPTYSQKSSWLDIFADIIRIYYSNIRVVFTP